MPSRAIKAAGTRWPTCASCTDGAIIGIISGWDTKQQRLEPDAEQSARPVLRGAPDSNAVAPTRLVYGRTRSSQRIYASGKLATTRCPMAEWKVVVKDRYPAYIGWTEF